MNFGEAIEAMKGGCPVARSGWNGKDMHIFLERNIAAPGEYEPVIVMWTAQKKYQPGWLASQPDMLAEDWGLVGSH